MDKSTEWKRRLLTNSQYDRRGLIGVDGNEVRSDNLNLMPIKRKMYIVINSRVGNAQEMPFPWG